MLRKIGFEGRGIDPDRLALHASAVARCEDRPVRRRPRPGDRRVRSLEAQPEKAAQRQRVGSPPGRSESMLSQEQPEILLQQCPTVAA